MPGSGDGADDQLHLPEGEYLPVFQGRVGVRSTLRVALRDVIGGVGVGGQLPGQRDVVGVQVRVEDVGDLRVHLLGDGQVALHVRRRIDHGHGAAPGPHRIRQAGFGDAIQLNHEMSPVVEQGPGDEGIRPAVHAPVEVVNVGLVDHVGDHARRSPVGADDHHLPMVRQFAHDVAQIGQHGPVGNVEGVEPGLPLDLPSLEGVGRPYVEDERRPGRIVQALGQIVGGDGAAHPAHSLRCEVCSSSPVMGPRQALAQTRIRS